MASAPTYTPIATQTVSGSTTTTVSFTFIPQTYTDLILICNASTVSGNYDIGLQFNSDTSGSYSFTYIRGNGSVTSSSRSVGQVFAWTDWAGYTTTIGQTITHINNYSNSTTYKTVLSHYGNLGSAVDSVVSLWRNTAAITRIDATMSGGFFASGSTVTLYGILAA